MLTDQKNYLDFDSAVVVLPPFSMVRHTSYARVSDRDADGFRILSNIRCSYGALREYEKEAKHSGFRANAGTIELSGLCKQCDATFSSDHENQSL